ncbi:MAG: MarR family transcriptional regulator [Anaerolineales bacterium]|nr:MarR family transcriptional regulator [Anaerolineales bacterium]MCW5856471.1 MarR family transcriptional regulator [Anaerolineales bacterium]
MASSTNYKQFGVLMARLEKLGLGSPKADIGLSLPQIGLLAMVWREPGLRVSELAERLGVTAPTVSVALRKLEQDDWLHREPDPQDKRSTHLYLSEKAERLARQIGAMRQKRLNQFMSGLNIEEQQQLLTLLDKAISNLEQRAPANKAGRHTTRKKE